MRLRQRFKWPVVAAAGLVLAGGGTAYAVTSGEDAPHYRTVQAGRGDVEQTLSLTGLVDAAHRSDLAFGTDGTVAEVTVKQGDKVKAGQVIATLETESLDAAVTEAESSLAQAKAQLESDRNAQSSAVQDASDPTQPTKPTQPTQPSGGTDKATQALLKKLKAQQDAVLTAQSAASAAIAAAKQALSAQTAACANAYGNAAQDAEDAEDVQAETTTDDADAGCDAALADVQAKQAVVNDAQDALADALDDLSKTLTAALGSLSQDGGDQPQSNARTTETPSVDDQSSGGQTITAARLASDQAQIDQAEADLITAKAARAQATLRSTRTGTLASLDLAKGDNVATGSAVGVVIGGKAVTLTGTVAEANVGKVKVGQKARVTVPGSETSTEGTVTAIGMTADSSSGSTTYPVTITVEDPAIALPTGSRAQVAIVIATAKDVVTLPISAISRTGDNAMVRVWNGKTLERTPVTLGAIGSRTVAVTAGVKAGDEVVVADVDQAITGASDELNDRGGFFGDGGPPVVFREGGPKGGGPSVSFGSPAK